MEGASSMRQTIVNLAGFYEVHCLEFWSMVDLSESIALVGVTKTNKSWIDGLDKLDEL